MRPLRNQVVRIFSLLRKGKLASELDEEFSFHVACETNANIARGMSPQAARRQALIDFGSTERAAESCSEQHSFSIIEHAIGDLRYASRGLVRNPLFTLTVIVTLALGIGANTALFSVVNALLLHDLPYQDGNHLIYVSEFWPHEPEVSSPPSPDFAAWRIRGRTFADLEAYGSSEVLHVTGVGDPDRLDTTQISPGFLNMLGVRLALGRSFSIEEGRPGGSPTVLISHQVWEHRFASSASVIGKPIIVDGNSKTIVGVLPASFLFPDNHFGCDLLLPLVLDPSPSWNERSLRLLRVLARPKPGISPEGMRREFADIVRTSPEQEPPHFLNMRKDMQVTAMPLRRWLSGDVRSLLLILQAAVAMILLIACLNVANLQIGRAVSRQKEIALRACLGATRERVARQLLTESLLLGSLGGLVGVGLGAWALQFLLTFLPAGLPLLKAAKIDLTVLAFTTLVALFAGMGTGLASLVTVYQANLNDSLKDGGRFSGRGGRHALRAGLVVAEVAIAVMLLSGSGLLIRSFLHLRTADLGFDPANLVSIRVRLSARRYPTPEKQLAFFSQLLENAHALPDVVDAAIAGGLPLIGSSWRVGAVVSGRPAPPPGGAPAIPLTQASSSYFRSLSIPLLRGRQFSEQDHEGSPLVVAVNDSFARRFFPNQDAIGGHVKFGSVAPGPWYEIIAIFGNVRQEHPRSADSPNIYVPYRQYPDPTMLLLLKTARPILDAPQQATRLVHAIDPEQPIEGISTMEELMAESISSDRANMNLMAIFAGVAVTLAAVGIFGVVAYFVSHRSHEIGVRMALGAAPWNVLWLVLRSGLAMTVAGLVIGLGGALACTRALRSSLYGISAYDPLTLAAVSGALLLVGLVACALPAIRAARITPGEILRYE